VQRDECITDNGRHLIDRAGVGPIRVMNGGKGQALRLRRQSVNWPPDCTVNLTYPTFQGCQQHVRRIQAMYEIRRKSGRLLHGIDWK
jgi:hypothetical protein